MPQQNRRTFVGSMAAASLTAGHVAAQETWSAGPVRHILPTASHEALLLKASFVRPLAAPPVLEVDGRRVTGARTAADGRYWRFAVRGLRPDRAYRLRLTAGREGASDPWTLRTTPAPDARPARFRLLAFTCAGGDEDSVFNGRRAYLKLATRRALLQRGLSFKPDAVLAIGDHVYWDQESGLRRTNGQPTPLNQQIGMFAPGADPAANARVLEAVGRRQVADLYGVELRSTPCWFVRDDHDYFENDEWYGDRGTFPISKLLRSLTDQLQSMFWPEFLPDPGGAGRLPGAGRSFGALRWGRLFEALIYDCRGYLSLDDANARFVPPAVEAWIAARTRDSSVRHVAQTPSTPWGWTAGKWGEWYPDVLGPSGRPEPGREKPGWRSGWYAQHQRLLTLAGSRGRDSLSISGDLHAVGAGRIARCGDVTPAAGVHSLLTGPLGSDDLAFPSAFRGTPPFIPAAVDLETYQAPLEKAGFTLMDVTPGDIRIRQFAWRSPTPEAAIASLQPILDMTIPTPG